MNEGIEVHYYPERGELSLWCGKEDFSRISTLVVAEAGIAEVVGEQLASLQMIVVETRPLHRQSRLKKAIMAFGCGVLMIAVLFVFITGVYAILGWLR